MRLDLIIAFVSLLSCSTTKESAQESAKEQKQPAETTQEKIEQAPAVSADKELQTPHPEEDEMPHSKSLEAQVSFENSEFGLKDTTPGRNYATRTLTKVRNGAGEHFPVVDMLPEGKRIYVIQIQSGWAQIGADKWVSMRALTNPK